MFNQQALLFSLIAAAAGTIATASTAQAGEWAAKQQENQVSRQIGQ